MTSVSEEVPEPEPSATVDEISQIMSLGYFAVSTDGLVRAVVTGDQRLRSVEFSGLDGADIGEVTDSVSEAIRGALVAAQRETVSALQQIPELDGFIPSGQDGLHD